MKQINAEYDRRIAELTGKVTEQAGASRDASVLEREIRDRVAKIVSGDAVPDNFYGNLLDQIMAFPDRRVEISLKCLPTRWTYMLQNQAANLRKSNN